MATEKLKLLMTFKINLEQEKNMYRHVITILLFLAASCSNLPRPYNFEENSEYKGRKYRVSVGEFRASGDPAEPNFPQVEITPFDEKASYPILTKKDKIIATAYS